MSSLTIHFRTLQVTDPTCDPPAEIEVSQLVTPNQPLVSRNDTKDSNQGIIRPQAGEHTQLLEDGSTIASTAYGYPRIVLESTERGQYAQVSVVPMLRISEDLMEARVLLHPPIGGTESPTLELIQELLEAAGVVFGIEKNVIEKGLARVAELQQPLEIVGARGKAPLHGRDAELQFEVEVGPIPGQELGNGSIDFRERNLFVPVAENQIIARKSKATTGISGTNLAGTPLPATDGKDLQVKVAEDVAYNEEDGTVRATTSGVLTIVGKDTIRVSAQQKIDGDVDYSTGNIRSHDAVHVVGSIRPDFMVSTRGDILVGGDIQAGTVNSHANIVVKGGILGPTATIKVQGDADIRHIERSVLQAGGDVILRGSSYYSTISAGGNISGAATIKVMGGELLASGSITIGKIGSAAASPGRLAVGVDVRRYKRYREMQKNYQQLLTDTKNWYTRHGGAKKSTRIATMEEEMAQIEREIGRFNLIPGTPEDSLGDPGCFFTPASVTILTSIAAGTTIRIGNETITTKHDLGKARFSLDKNSGAITLTTG